jgi:hypothetical protein
MRYVYTCFACLVCTQIIRFLITIVLVYIQLIEEQSL